MVETIIIKNKPNWIITLFFPFAFVPLFFIILIILPITAVESNYAFWALNYIISVIPFLGFLIVFFYIWLWNTFGKVILEVSTEKIKVTNKNKLFDKPKEYKNSEIRISILDLGIEKTKYFVRPNNLFSKFHYSLTIQKDLQTIRIVDWLNIERAKNILETINKIMNAKK